jgi:DNA-binding MarR family transcriptional regulator
MTDEPARRAWQAMRTLVLDRHDRRAEISARLGISYMRIKVVNLLAQGPLAMKELAGQLAVDAPYATVVVDDLEARGLVERRPDPVDRRRKIVAITTAGRKLSRQAVKLASEPPAEVAALSADDLAHLDRIMGLLLAD